MVTRCAWVPPNDDLYAAYHDREWGVPLHDERALFELLCLEGAQAGLSWRTILARREGYRVVFDGFDPDVVAAYEDHRLDAIVKDSRIIRNRMKVYATRDNARAVLWMRSETTLDRLLWDFVGGRPVRNAWESVDQIPAVTPQAEELSRLLRTRGFRFVGPTICYAFMQSAGMVNDHTLDCFRHGEIDG
jgi:DNA-3-methyladenine glycosylase I